MKQKTIFCLNIIIVFFLLHSFTCPALGSIKKKLTADITLNVNWNIESGDEVNKGSLQLRINGKLTVNKTFSSAEYDMPAVLIPYKISRVNASYVYKETKIHNDPPKSCPKKVIAKYSGSGSLSFEPVPQFGDFYVQHLGGIMKTLQDAGITGFEGSENMVDFYRFHTASQVFQIKGQKLKDCEYVNAEKNGHSGIKIGFKMDKNGEMSGQKSWSAHFQSGTPDFHVEINNLPDKMSDKPFVPSKSSQGNVNYRLSWDIGEQKAPDIKLKKVFFNYEKNSKERIVLDLKKLDTGSDIEAPEWIKDSKSEPAAFVLGETFSVKAVFESENKDTEKLEVWAEEEVLEGNGGFGGIGNAKGKKRKIIDVKQGEFDGEFKIDNAQETIGINKVSWTWYGKDKTEGKEEVTLYLGESKHTIYVVGSGPGGKVLDQKFNKYVYIVRKGCGWAKGSKGGKPAFDRIWSNFKEIPGPNNETLVYSHAEKNYDTTSLLNSGRGACGAWSEFFYDMTACQGIQVEEVTIHPAPPFDIIIVGDFPAQGNPSPERAFTEHSLNVFKDKFYDPSYHFSMIKNYFAYENDKIVVYCNTKNVVLEEYLKNKFFGDRVNSCDAEWDRYNKGEVPNKSEFADCIAKENSQCAPNDIRMCELLECPEWARPPTNSLDDDF